MTVASFHLTRYPRDFRRHAAPRMWFDRAGLRATPGLRFWRLLGTARGDSMGLSVDPDRWAAFAVWDGHDALAEFCETSPIARFWRERGLETCTVELTFLSGHGSWGSQFPFRAVENRPQPPGSPVAVLTRASVRARRLRRFYRAVPSVDAELARTPGLLRSVGAGEWPLARQLTFSIWQDLEAMTAFAYRGAAHREVIRRTRAGSWFGEEMFCRFAITRCDGYWDGRRVLQPAPRDVPSGSRHAP